MPTIITRVFSTAAEADRAVKQLDFRGLPKRDRCIIVANDNAEAQMAQARVHESAIAPYSKELAAGKAVVVVNAGYKPLGVARMTREIFAKYNALDTGKVINEHKLPWEPDHAPSVMKDHPHFLTLPDLEFSGQVSTMFGISTLSQHRKKRALVANGRPMSAMFWPMALVSKKSRSKSVMAGTRHMSRLFWPMPLLSNRARRSSVIPGGGFPFSRRLGLKLIS